MCEHDAIVRLRDRVLTPKASSESLALGLVEDCREDECSV